MGYRYLLSFHRGWSGVTMLKEGMHRGSVPKHFFLNSNHLFFKYFRDISLGKEISDATKRIRSCPRSLECLLAAAGAARLPPDPRDPSRGPQRALRAWDFPEFSSPPPASPPGRRAGRSLPALPPLAPPPPWGLTPPPFPAATPPGRPGLAGIRSERAQREAADGRGQV